MKSIYYILLTVLIFMTACNDEFDKNNSVTRKVSLSTNISEYLSVKPEYTSFLEAIDEYRLNEWLEEQATMTVFAINNKGMEALKNSGENVKDYLQYHLCVGSYTINDLMKVDRIKTILGKYHNISHLPSLEIDNMTVSNEVLCKNGVVYEISQPFAFLHDVYGQIMRMSDDYRMVKEYIADADTLIFDRELSKPVGIDEQGQTVYDTVWIYQNEVLKVGKYDVTAEDHFFTAFIPSDQQIETNFNSVVQTLEEAKGEALEESLKKKMKEWCLTSLFYAGQLEDARRDTTIELINKVRYDTGVEKVNMDEKITASNGVIYPLDEYRIARYTYMGKIFFRPQNLFTDGTTPQDDLEEYFKLYSGLLEKQANPIDNRAWWGIMSVRSTTAHGDGKYGFKTHRVSSENEIFPLPISPGEYDVYVKATRYSARANYNKLIFAQEFDSDETITVGGPGAEYQAWDPLAATSAGLFVGRVTIPDDWGFKPVVMITQIGDEPRIPPHAQTFPRAMLEHIRLVPTENNF
ncbi:MAG: fasciclin domain-containing protein [Carboxylicivirga sp.]|nr:fasciclin domain-containing protein [Carboxylicivirga sp.]